MTTFTFPTSAELQQIAQDKMPRLTQDRPAFDLMPMRTVDSQLLIWEQLDNYEGLQQVRGMDGAPSRIAKTGVSRFMMEPGVYGEFEQLDELELTARRQVGTFGTPVDISDLVMQIQDKLLQRRLDRIELLVWTLLTTGTFAVSGEGGRVVYTDSYPVQTFTAATTWATSATSTPLGDFRQVQLKHRGHSVNFGASAQAYMNRKTWNNLISNTNPDDLYGRRQQGLGLINNIQDVNRLFGGDDLPQIAIYDEGYISDGNDGNTKGTFVPFIADNTAVVVGKRPAGQTVGEYRMTRNANNPDLGPGAYMRVIDRGENHVPRTLEVHDGHNGGPVVYYPAAVVMMSV